MGVEPDRDQVTTVHDEELEISPLSDDNDTAPTKLSAKVWPAGGALMLTWLGQQSLILLATSVMPYINIALGPYPNYTWIATSFSTAVAILFPISGSLSDTFGRRYFFLGGNLVALIGTIVCSTAKSVPIVILGMTLAGIGASSQQMVLAAMSEIFPNKYRGFAQASLSSISFPFNGMGPFIAHLMVVSDWHWVFYLPIILNGGALVTTALFYYPPLPNQEYTRKALLRRIDVVGLIVYMIGFTSFLIGVSWAGSQFAWRSVAVLVPLLLGLLLLVLLGFWEVYFAKFPLFPPALFKDLRGFTFVLFIVFVVSMPLYALLGFWPLQISAVYTSSARQIGIWSLPLTLGNEFGAVLVGLTIRWWKPTNWYATGFAVVFTIFNGLMSTLSPSSINPAHAYTFFAGTAVGALEIVCVILIQFSVGPEHIGKATALLCTTRAVAGAIGVSVYTTILQTGLGSDLAPRIARAVLPAGLPGASLPLLIKALLSGKPELVAEVPGVTPTIIAAAVAAVKQSYTKSFRPIYYLCAGMGALGVMFAFFARDISYKMNSTLNVDLNRAEKSHLARRTQKKDTNEKLEQHDVN